MVFFFFSSRRRHTRLQGDWSSDVCSSDLSLGELRVDGRDAVNGARNRGGGDFGALGDFSNVHRRVEFQRSVNVCLHCTPTAQLADQQNLPARGTTEAQATVGAL